MVIGCLLEKRGCGGWTVDDSSAAYTYDIGAANSVHFLLTKYRLFVLCVSTYTLSDWAAWSTTITSICSERTYPSSYFPTVQAVLYIAVPGRPLVQLALRAAAELEKLLPILLEEVQDAGDAGILEGFRRAESATVDMDM